ncbi:hypothetical protein Tco_0261996 [Tanacetum coccineum]
MTLFKIGTSKRSSLGEEDASKQGRNLKQGKQRSTFEESDVDEDLDKAQVSAVLADVSTGDAVNTAGTEVNTASAPVTTAGISVTTVEPGKRNGYERTTETATRPTVPPQQHDPKDKGKAKMVEQEKPLKKKDQIKFDEEVAQRLEAQLQAELEEEERLAKQREEDANIVEWDNVQAMIDADYELALKNKSFDEVQNAFDKTMSWIDSFVPMDSKVVKNRAEGKSTKKQKVDDDDKEKEDLKQCFEIILAEEMAINTIPLATKPAPIVDFQIHTKGKQGYYEIIRADGSSMIYLVFSQLLKEFNKEYLENLWRLVKAKHVNTRPKEAY